MSIIRKEIWKDVPGYEGIYIVSNLGNLKSLDRYITRNDGITYLKRGKIIQPVENKDGYLQCKLCRDGECHTTRVHRIVANAFIANPNNLPEINHKDCNRKNNHVDNLEWTTHLENVQYSTNLGHYKTKSGAENPNYGNTKLKKFFKENPEEKMRQSRPGSQNGRAKKICMIIDGKELYFDYVGACAQYLLDNNIVSNIKYSSLHARILERLRNKKPYHGLTFYDI